MSAALNEANETWDDDYGLDDDERECSYCGGDGYGIVGADWDNDDPVNTGDGTIEKCPNCGGSGEAKDMTFW